MDSKKVVIVGAGPAGIATALQLKRSSIDAVLVEQNEIGGLLRNANFVENYPGFPEGIKGLELVELFKKHLKIRDVDIHFERVLELELKNERFFTKTNLRKITSKIAVIASGTKPKKPSVPFISKDVEDRIFYEVYPILKVKNQEIAIIGAGDAAFDYALSLSQNNSVFILNRSSRIKSIPALFEKCKKSNNILYREHINIKEIRREGSKLLLTCSPHQIKVDYAIFAVGREPYLDFLGDGVIKQFEHLIKTDALFIIGDAKNEIYRQAAICIGDGIKTAMKIHKKLRK
ncbi:MAG: hypothetical protein B6244_09915 [Candidatus Cloacimonetes bacterium 4572_55]|nr:MAG: hypothetical protein B6244_09915 [Candidatus Cloacimonetes bacterium 4572_55]